LGFVVGQNHYTPSRRHFLFTCQTNLSWTRVGDNIEWKLVNQGEFSNIKNNPLWQIKKFAPEKARYIKLRALSNTEGNNNTGYAEVDVITN
jgi:alpha-L-fucosidase